MQPRYAFFDLDGTIVNSAQGILNSLNYATQKMDLPPFTMDDTWQFIGPPLLEVFSKHRGLDTERATEAVACYREYYAREGILACSVYGGVRELLDALTKGGIQCVLATCKPHIFAKQILSHHQLDRYFSFVSGPELNGTRNTKSEVIAHAMEVLHITNANDVIMIGDRADDVIGAKACKIDCIGVLWGFGSSEELVRAGAREILQTPNDILTYIKKQ